MVKAPPPPPLQLLLSSEVVVIVLVAVHPVVFDRDVYAAAVHSLDLLPVLFVSLHVFPGTRNVRPWAVRQNVLRAISVCFTCSPGNEHAHTIVHVGSDDGTR